MAMKERLFLSSGEKLEKNYLLRSVLLLVKNQGYRLEVENQENLSRLKELLNRHSAIAYFNHITSADGALIMASFVEKEGFNFQVVAPVARKNSDFFRSPFNASILKFGQALGVKLYPVVQHYDYNSYSEKENLRLSRAFFNQFKSLSQNPGTLFLIAPEGTRNKSGSSLQKAQEGIGLMAKINPDVYFMPVGIIPQEKISPGLNLGKRFSIVYGSPFKLDKEEIKRKSREEISRDLMARLAEMLPENMRREEDK